MHVSSRDFVGCSAVRFKQFAASAPSFIRTFFSSGSPCLERLFQPFCLVMASAAQQTFWCCVGSMSLFFELADYRFVRPWVYFSFIFALSFPICPTCQDHVLGWRNRRRTVTRGSADILAQDDCSACDFVTSKPAEPSCAFSGLTWIPPWSPCCRPCLYLCCGVLSLPPNACLSKVWRQRAVWQRHFVVQASAVFLRSTGKGIADMKTVIFLAAHQDSGVRNANWSRCWLPPSPKLNAAHYHHGAHAVVHASICSVVCWVCLQTLVSLRSDISEKSDSDTLPFRPRQCCCGAQAMALLLTWKR